MLTDTQVEVYDILGVQIAVHDNNNLSCLGNAWGGYLLGGTNDGDMVLINPNDWNQVVVYHSPLKQKQAVESVEVCEQGLALIKCKGGYFHYVVHLESRRVTQMNEEPRAQGICQEWALLKSGLKSMFRLEQTPAQIQKRTSYLVSTFYDGARWQSQRHELDTSVSGNLTSFRLFPQGQKLVVGTNTGEI